MRTTEEFTIEDLQSQLKAILPNQIDEAYVQMLTVLCVFLKENQLGQSVYTEYVQETKCPIDKSGPLVETEFDPMSNKNEPLQTFLVEHLSLNSEQFYVLTQFPILFVLLDLQI